MITFEKEKFKVSYVLPPATIATFTLQKNK